MPLKLVYFPGPWRGEVARLILTIGKVDFEDERVRMKDDWPTLKPKMPFGQIPVLEVDGKQLAQKGAIDHYCARISGLMPQDPWEAALADQAYFCCEDIGKLFIPNMYIKDLEERAKAHAASADSQDFKYRMAALSKLLESKPGRFVSGDKVTHGDLALFVTLSTMLSLKGVPPDVLQAYPTIRAYRNSVASLEPVAGFYAKETDEARAAFRADTD